MVTKEIEEIVADFKRLNVLKNFILIGFDGDLKTGSSFTIASSFPVQDQEGVFLALYTVMAYFEQQAAKVNQSMVQ